MTDTTDALATTEVATEKKITKVRTSITIAPEVLEAARKQAETTNVSVSNLIETALKTALGVV